MANSQPLWVPVPDAGNTLRIGQLLPLLSTSNIQLEFLLLQHICWFTSLFTPGNDLGFACPMIMYYAVRIDRSHYSLLSLETDIGLLPSPHISHATAL